jgi:hypothetical protein
MSGLTAIGNSRRTLGMSCPANSASELVGLLLTWSGKVLVGD